MRPRVTRCIVLVFALVAASGCLRAQAPLAAMAGRWIEAGAFYQAVSNRYGDWSGAFARAVIPVGARDILYGDALAQRAFHDRGAFVSLADRHEWSADFFTISNAIRHLLQAEDIDIPVWQETCPVVTHAEKCLSVSCATLPPENSTG